MAITNISVEVKEDGVYLTVSKTNPTDTVENSALMDKIEEFAVKDVDLTTLTKLKESKELMATVKISNNKEIAAVDEVALVNISKDRKEGFIKFIAPVNGGTEFTKSDMESLLTESGILFGINEALLDELVISRQYDKYYKIAEYVDKFDGVNGYIKYYFNTDKKGLAPAKLEDGSVDYLNLNLVEVTTAGTKLAEIIPPIEGKDGSLVTGEPIIHKPGKPSPALPRGKNVKHSDDGMSILAGCDGQIEYVNNKLQINEVLTLAEVGPSTGNIDFNGAVIITGNVLTGYTVKAKGNIEVKGVVEAAKIESGGDVILTNGIMGHEKGEVICAGNLLAKFIDSATLVVGGNIEANSIMHSNTNCDKSIILEGKNGLLVGGKTCVTDEIIAVVIGAPMATITILEVGNTPAKVANFKLLEESVKSIEAKLLKTEQIINVLKSATEELPPEKKNMLLKSFHTKIYLTTEKTKVENKIAELLPTLESERGKIVAQKIIYPGVKLMVGSATMNITDDMKSVRFVNKDGTIDVSGAY